MVRTARILLALAAFLLAACGDQTGERTRRDFQEIGAAQLGEVRLRLDPGVALRVDAESQLVRFRANAPDVRLRASSTAVEPRRLLIEIENVDAHAVTPTPSVPFTADGPRTIRFEVRLEAGGSAEIAVADAAVESPAPFRFAWVGDVQGGLDGFALIRERIRLDPRIEFVLFAGDDTQQGSMAQLEAFCAAADQLPVPWYSVLGNHETIRGNEENFQRRVGRINVAFDYRGSRFVLIDSASGTIDPRVTAWLDDPFGPGGPSLRVAAMHIAPFDFSGWRDGAFSSRAEAAALVSRFVEGGVDLVLSGHFHTLEYSSAGGIPFVISGNGGVGTEAAWDGSSTHYLAVDVDPTAQRVEATAVHVH